MEKQFASVAMSEKHKNWERITQRENELYSRLDDIRSPFARDYTRILHSLAYRRLKHKTQVFYNAAGNDHICTRMEHVLHVESVSNTIARQLGLNEELTKAIAMAHDLGHAPFGHQGEKIIRKLTKQYLGKNFWHEQNGVYFVDNIELLEDNQQIMRNLHLTYGVRDGIISHCGEMDQNSLCPRDEIFDLKEFDEPGKYQASTWEGCVVKLSDKIAYLGRDIEDATRLGYLSDEAQKLLLEMAKSRNDNAVNTTVIMHNMIIDLCQNSSPEKGLCLSDEMSQQLNEIKRFNYENIYSNKRLKPFELYSELVINQLFETLVSYYDLYGQDVIAKLSENAFDQKSFVKGFVQWLVQYVDKTLVTQNRSVNIVQNCDNRKIYGSLNTREQYLTAVIDFISGMTDMYAINAFEELLRC